MANPRVWWSALMERNVQDNAVLSLLRVASECGAKGYRNIQMPYARTDTARNKIIDLFLAHSDNPNDAMVMMDNDHILPDGIVEQLTRHDPTEYGVVAAQAHRRGAPFDMCAFVRMGDKLHPIAEWEPGAMLECAIAGTGAIMIRRWVFDKLRDNGVNAPYFRYTYSEHGKESPSEDMYFGAACERIGVSHWVDASVKIPHLTTSLIDESSFIQWLADNPNQTQSVEEMEERLKRNGNGEHAAKYPEIATRVEV